MFMKLLRRLFGATEQPAGAGAQSTSTVEPIEHEGFLIYPEPQREGSQYRLAGRICKQVEGELKTHLFIRSDIISDKEEACRLMVEKAKNFILHTQGDIFR
jgi:hypothetical protein